MLPNEPYKQTMNICFSVNDFERTTENDTPMFFLLLYVKSSNIVQLSMGIYIMIILQASPGSGCLSVCRFSWTHLYFPIHLSHQIIHIMIQWL